MKFARLLRTTSETLPDVASLFQSYKALKKQLKQLPQKPPQPSGTLQGVQGPGVSTARPRSADDAIAEQLLPVLQQRRHWPVQEARSGVVAGFAARPGSVASVDPRPGAGAMAGAVPASTTDIATDEERDFVEAFSRTLQKHNEIFLEKEEHCIIRLEQLEAEVRSLTDAGHRRQTYARLVDFHGEVMLLMHWSVLAYTATVKILKKHYKRTGLLLCAPHLGDLLSQPFCSTEMMTSLAAKAERVICQLTATASGHATQHDSMRPFGTDTVMASRQASSAACARLSACAAPAAVASGPPPTCSADGMGPEATSRCSAGTAAAHAPVMTAADAVATTATAATSTYSAGTAADVAATFVVAAGSGVVPAMAAAVAAVPTGSTASEQEANHNKTVASGKQLQQQQPQPPQQGLREQLSACTGEQHTTACGFELAELTALPGGAAAQPSASTGSSSSDAGSISSGAGSAAGSQATAGLAGTPGGHGDHTAQALGANSALGADMVHRTQVALTTWEHLCTTASTPSTVFAATGAGPALLAVNGPSPGALHPALQPSLVPVPPVCGALPAAVPETSDTKLPVGVEAAGTAGCLDLGQPSVKRHKSGHAR